MSFSKALILTTILFLAQEIVSQLTSESVAVRPCTPRTGYPYANLLFAYNPLNNWYMNYGSRHVFRSYAESFLGYPPANQSQIDEMNLRLSLTGTLISNRGYGSGFFQQICVPIIGPSLLNTILSGGAAGALLQANCTPIQATATNNNYYLQAASPSEEAVLWTDNSNVLVISRCIGSGAAASEDWKILSLTPTISQTLLSSIVANLTRMGFDTTGY